MKINEESGQGAPEKKPLKSFFSGAPWPRGGILSEALYRYRAVSIREAHRRRGIVHGFSPQTTNIALL
jgi:hypothetical protein